MIAVPGASEQTSQVKVLIVANIFGSWLAPTGLTRVNLTSPGP